MIFVTLGTHYKEFPRLAIKMDEIAGKIDEKVVIQIGHTNYTPVHAEYFKFLEQEKMKKYYREARIVVTHAGVGSILTALGQKTPIIVVPRQKKFGEHMDDHQLEFVTALSEMNKVKVVYDIDELDDCIKANYEPVTINNTNKLVDSLKQYVSSIDKKTH